MAIMLTLLIPLPSFATILLQKQEPESHTIPAICLKSL